MATVSKHASFLFFPFELASDETAKVERGVVEPLLRRTLRQVSERLPLPGPLRERLDGEDGEVRLWQEARRQARDLHPEVRAILGIGGEEITLPPHLCRKEVKRFLSHAPLELTKQAKEILSGAWGTRGGGLEVQLRPVAVGRLGLTEPAREGGGTQKKKRRPRVWLPVYVENVTVWFCGTGVGMVVVELRFTTVDGEGRLGTAGVIEGNYACYRTASQAEPMRWRQAGNKGGAGEGLWSCITRDADGESAGETTLEEIVSALVPLSGARGVAEEGDGGTVQGVPIHWERLFTYTAVQLAEPLASERERAELAYRLSRKNTAAYLPSEDRLREGVVVAYDNVLHATALEGGAVIVEERMAEGRPVSFLKDFIANSVRSVYLNLAMFAFQEYCKLLRMVEGTALPVSLDTATGKDLDYLDAVRRRLLEFQLNHRFSQASLLTIHNRVYEEWRRVLWLDRMLAELREDVSQVTSYLDYTLQQRREERRNRLGRVQSVLGIVIGAAIGLTGVFGMNIRGFQDVPWNGPFALTWIGAIAGGGVALAVAYYWWSSRIERR